MWHEGTILAPTKEGKTVVHYWAKVYDEGRISKLTLKENGKVIYNYDRGEDVPEQNEAAEIALAILMYEYK